MAWTGRGKNRIDWNGIISADDPVEDRDLVNKRYALTLAGSSTLAGLSDVSLTSPTNGQVLKFAGGVWVNAADAGVTGSGSNNRLTFWNGSSTVSSNANILVDVSNGSKGIMKLTGTAGNGGELKLDSGSFAGSGFLTFQDEGTSIYQLQTDSSSNLNITNVVSGNVPLKANSDDTLTVNSAFTLPKVDGSANQVLKTDGAGVVTWSTPASVTTGNLTETGSSVLTITGGTGAVVGSGTTIQVANAAADGSTKGVAAFTAADFNASSGVISIDYANGQEASASQDGFLSQGDWANFSNQGLEKMWVATTSPEELLIAQTGYHPTLLSTTALVANGTFHCYPFFSGRGGTLNKIGARCGAGVATSKFRVGIYTNASNTAPAPSTLVVESGELDGSTGGLKTGSISQVLSPNTIYWICILTGTAAPTIENFLANGLPIIGFSTAANPYNEIQATQTYGALPSTFPATYSYARTNGSILYREYSA